MTNFSISDIQQIESHGLTIDTINKQLTDFQNGFPYSNIVSACIIGNGAFNYDDQIDKYIDIYNHDCNKYRIVKFVPASGAATRMFKDLFEYLSTGQMNKTTQNVLDNIEQFAFWDDLKKILPDAATDTDKIKYLVTEIGLDYGNKPKGLLQFHKYQNESRTAIAEHLIEGALYARANDTVRIHFTVSPEHMNGFQELLDNLVPTYETKFGIKYEISMSTQKKHTDTIAVNMDNTPFRNEDGTLLFRPAGHGALIANLNDIDADIVFIKNIDNVCPDHMRADTVTYKKLIGGILIDIKNKIFEYLHALDSGTADINEISKFIQDTLNITLHSTPTTDTLYAILNRPIRICGIIKNTGAPGGGPFLVRDASGLISPQIVEPGQIAPEKISILHDGEYFSPTDIACYIRDYRGCKFNLIEHVDETAGFISTKSKNGRDLRAMERPGLWNGAMAKWNTIFVITPCTTFTPAKTIIDLITPDHLAK